jgi:hypothetical protein
MTFEGCLSLETVTLPEGLTTINSGTFTLTDENRYPNSVKGGSITFTGTLLSTTEAVAGYVDTATSLFSMSDAVQLDGTPADLQYIDFVNVHTAYRDFALPGLRGAGPASDATIIDKLPAQVYHVKGYYPVKGAFL